MIEIPRGFLSEHSEQEKAREFLWSAISSGRLASTYIFAGPQGVGKLHFAIQLAQFLNCPNKRDGMPCGVCQSCKTTISLSHPDVIVIFPMPKSVWENSRDEAYGELVKNLYIRPKFEISSSILLGMINEVKQFISTPPIGRMKIIIVADAHTMSSESSNAFLKILEEPAPYAHIFLTTNSLETLLPTIRSRAQIVGFQRLSYEQLKPKLVGLFGVPHDSVEFIARWGDGSITRALSASSKEFRKMRIELDNLFIQMLEKKWGDVLEWFTNCPNKFDEATLLLDIIISFVRDVMVFSAGKPDLCVNSDLMMTIRRVSQELDFKKASELFLLLNEKRSELERNPQYKLFWGAVSAKFFRVFSECK